MAVFRDLYEQVNDGVFSMLDEMDAEIGKFQLRVRLGSGDLRQATQVVWSPGGIQFELGDNVHEP